ncbi:5-bromo-4-chloroindolyl phosphate hydrolysis family protein [Bacillus sp. V5-8f]|uniref:5-bromo-4-chloroindolyl phosphate hydrolysis family protein n=1 Tax=Bacillus sp. V5-8f TaxID=2053044 RepID=UPI000C760D16|nr:5-bromo-4-chloroindolyl phosphate hydrolysis family protein [Bacillus sp. V5-8f]PLT33385.1 protein xpaC [Bacillus sp. V5-8f]
MNPFIAYFIGVLFAVPAAVIVWLVSVFAFGQSFLSSGAFSLVGGILLFFLVPSYLKYRMLKKHGLTRKEYHYISQNLREAKLKISRLNKALFSVRQIASLKQNIELMRVIRKIHSLTKKEPKRFYKAERFYFSHLDSVVELTEKYVFLSSQPKKSPELEQSLKETRRMIEEMNRSIEQDLYHVLSDDIDDLHYEIDVAKHSINTIIDSPFQEESRSLR